MCPAAHALALEEHVRASMPCVWGSACLPNCGPTACDCSCGAVYHPCCAAAGVFTLLGREHEDDSCGTCGECAAGVAAAGLAFPPSAPPRKGGCDAPPSMQPAENAVNANSLEAAQALQAPGEAPVALDEQKPSAKRVRRLSASPAPSTSVFSPTTLGNARGGARGGAAARGARAQEVVQRGGTATTVRNAHRPPRRLVQADTSARRSRGQGPGAAATVVPWHAPPVALSPWGAPVASHPPAAAPMLAHTPPPAHALAVAPAFDPLHPSNAAAIMAFSQLAGALLNSDAVKNDRSGVATTRMLDLLNNCISGAVTQPQAPQ